ncbi:MAG: glycosyltransferase [Prevotella sp.]|nr:glycosyltransferase [Prevotella sp.]
MLSIIICSKHRTLNSNLLENIRMTIGTEFEIIHIDNSNRKYGICSAYNEGVRRSKGDILCFMHEDILYHSSGWGKIVENFMQDYKVGMLGVAGSAIVSNVSDWRFGGYQFVHIVQGYQTLSNPPYYYTKGIEWDTEESPKRVVIIDGCWFCLRKESFIKDMLWFDEETFRGFHLYDSDISMQVNKTGKHIYICSNIIIEHFSKGIYTFDFKDGLSKFLRKWKDDLPYSIIDINEYDLRKLNKQAETKLEKRIKQDGLTTMIKKYFTDIHSGCVPPQLPKEAEQLIEASMYQFVKAKIKFSATNDEAFSAVKTYIYMQKKSHAWRIIWKYLYYRVLNRTRIKQIKRKNNYQ